MSALFDSLRERPLRDQVLVAAYEMQQSGNDIHGPETIAAWLHGEGDLSVEPPLDLTRGVEAAMRQLMAEGLMEFDMGAENN